MHAVRQKCRPKHQVLVLKCYPRLSRKDRNDVKPNNSELSYLLFYASTRRSKIQKVGAFLEKKTASDVWRLRSANVHVTLQILTALLSSSELASAHSFPLLAPFVLHILHEILGHTSDIGLVEASLPTWDAFCAHQDQATIAADQEYRTLYQRVVQQYAAFASKDGPTKLGKSMVSVPEAIRLRRLGLEALKSIVESDTLSSESGRQLATVLPAALSNLRSADAGFLSALQEMLKGDQGDEKRKALQRRHSMGTVRTAGGSEETDPRAAEGTTAEADRLAEEEIGALALQTIQDVFAAENRGQVRLATSIILTYLAALPQAQSVTSEKDSTRGRNHWATKLYQTMISWTPVQDRFIVLVTTVETLIRLPVGDRHLPTHILYTDLVDHIFCSDINLMGLSVMDVLLGLIQHVLRVLQQGNTDGSGSLKPQPPNLSREERLKLSTLESEKTPGIDSSPSVTRTHLLRRLQRCIADLATHVYYMDQIADMVAAVLLRLKATPGVAQNQAITAAAIEDPDGTAAEVASNASLTQTDGFFSFDTAREMALQLVQEIFLVARLTPTPDSRNAVPIDLWEGTQWLLRDPTEKVRRAYVGALCTWLKLETKRSDARISEPIKIPKKGKGDGAHGNLARRAVSNASARQRSEKKNTSTLLQLLSLAIYEDALDFAASSEPDILLLHLLLTTSTQKLGINAVKSTLPMMFRLQEDIVHIESPLAKIRIGALVHGYLSTVTDVFDFEHSGLGREIQSEISRRKHRALWMEQITTASIQMEQIPFTSQLPPLERPSEEVVQREVIKPFDHRQAMVDRIAESYSTVVSSRPVSAPGSPGRSFSLPSLNTQATSYSNAHKAPSQLPDKVKEEMLADWTKESCWASMAASAPKSVSLSGSRTSPSNFHVVIGLGKHRQLLAAANTPAASNNGTSPISHRQQALGLASRRLYSQSPDRRPSGCTSTGRKSSSAGAKSTLRLDDLKRVLAGGVPMATPGGTTARADAADDTASESLMDVADGEFGSESAYDGGDTERESKDNFADAVDGSPAAQASALQEPTGASPHAGMVTNGVGSQSATSSRRAESRPHTRMGGRRDLTKLLEGICIADTDETAAGRRQALAAPPY